MITVEPHELKPNTPEEQEHYDAAREDTASSLKNQIFDAWTGRRYICLGHFPCGYHMKPESGLGKWHCISERAIGRSYHRVWGVG